MAIRNVTRAGVGLVIGIIILGLLVWGGLWLVRERGDQARRQEAINIANEQLKSQSDQGVALNPDKDQSSNSQSQNSDNQNSNSTSQSGGSSSNNSSSNTSELPKTGPKETTAVVLGLLTFAVVSFVRSRKLLSNQL